MHPLTPKHGLLAEYFFYEKSSQDAPLAHYILFLYLLSCNCPIFRTIVELTFNFYIMRANAVRPLHRVFYFSEQNFYLFALEYHVCCSNGTHLAAHGAGMSVGRWGLLKESSCLFHRQVLSRTFRPNPFCDVPLPFYRRYLFAPFTPFAISAAWAAILLAIMPSLNVVNVRKSEVLGWGNIAEEVCTACCGDSSADS